jgi:hypothetical protein
MKTTKGKIKPAKPRGRMAMISRLEDDKIVAVRECEKLGQSLRDYFDETLKPRGYKLPKVVGNVLTCKTKQGRTLRYKAVDA